jgi:hypothetical protein
MARGPNRNKVLRVKPTISAQQMNYLEQLVEIGNYGNTPTAVALSLIQRGIDDMLGRPLITKKRVKAIKPPSMRSGPRGPRRTG